ncbi:hypothetical protein SALBM311S_04260 [Streptomyces alboniger]
MPPIDGELRGHAVADVIHLLAELVENATVFSAPHTQVLLRANLVTSGLAVEVEDRGLGMPVGEQSRMNALLADPDQVNVASLLADGRIGLFVVSQLAKRHGIHVRLQTNIYGGVQAVLVVPQALLGAAPGALAAVPQPPDGQPVSTGPTGPAMPPRQTGPDGTYQEVHPVRDGTSPAPSSQRVRRAAPGVVCLGGGAGGWADDGGGLGVGLGVGVCLGVGVGRGFWGGVKAGPDVGCGCGGWDAIGFRCGCGGGCGGRRRFGSGVRFGSGSGAGAGAAAAFRFGIGIGSERRWACPASRAGGAQGAAHSRGGRARHQARRPAARRGAHGRAANPACRRGTRHHGQAPTAPAPGPGAHRAPAA